MFAGEAYNVEQGVTNDLFPNERDSPPGCRFNATPEDHMDTSAATLSTGAGDIVNFALFMRFPSSCEQRVGSQCRNREL